MMAAPNWASTVGKPLKTAANNSIIDAEFETITHAIGSAAPTPLKLDKISTIAPNADNLSLLRNDSVDERVATHPDNLTPTFMLFTLVAAFVVFWVSGGHVLLY
jgi:hypothetical protein